MAGPLQGPLSGSIDHHRLPAAVRVWRGGVLRTANPGPQNRSPHAFCLEPMKKEKATSHYDHDVSATDEHDDHCFWPGTTSLVLLALTGFALNLLLPLGKFSENVFGSLVLLSMMMLPRFLFTGRDGFSTSSAKHRCLDPDIDCNA